ncbi:MAG: DUF4214 domain-containing protein, partial [Lachnospiraceae bacterium]|nr:DUF4214 domain-containing protein [Lachnospiraceae bacterium]
SSLEGRSRNPKLTAFIKRMYDKVLLREPDLDGLNFWCNAVLNKKMSILDMCTLGFIGSKEFVSRNYSNEEYLEILYATFFGREPDETGFAYWMGCLENEEKTRDEVLGDFAYSLEFRSIRAQFSL